MKLFGFNIRTEAEKQFKFAFGIFPPAADQAFVDITLTAAAKDIQFAYRMQQERSGKEMAADYTDIVGMGKSRFNTLRDAAKKAGFSVKEEFSDYFPKNQ